MRSLQREPSVGDLRVSNRTIAAWCIAPDRELLDNVRGSSRQVVRKGIFAIKYGNVRPGEARSQREAYRILDPSIVKVPFVYRYFTRKDDDERSGYLVMEYVPSSRPSSAYTEQDVTRVVDILHHMHSFRRLENPGPVGGGKSDGLLWYGDNEFSNLSFHTVSDLEDYLRTRMYWRQVDLTSMELVFCHCDISARNIIFTDDDKLCVIDWEGAGYYPLCFEYLALELTDRVTWPSLAKDVLRRLVVQSPLNDTESSLVKSMGGMRSNILSL